MNTDIASKSSNDVQGTLLVIDDTPENLTVLRKCLTDHHYRVAVARNGKVALERVKRIRPDLILLDVLMPGMDGFEVCRQLKADENTRAIPVIFMSALDTPEDKVKGFEAGAEDYVTKPLNYHSMIKFLIELPRALARGCGDVSSFFPVFAGVLTPFLAD